MNLKHLPIIVSGLAISLWSCSSNNDIPVSTEPQMLKLAAPILINNDSTVIQLADYLLKPGTIDSLELDNSLNYSISSDSTQMAIIPVDRDFPKLSVLKIWSGGFSYSLLLEKSSKLRYRFTFDPANKKYKRVQIKGQMNEWNPSAGYLFEKDGKWHIDFQLFPGKYQYKLILDGKEKTDPNSRDSVSNNNGGYNSLLTLGNLNPSGLPTLYTSSADGRKIVIGMKSQADSVFVFWQNYLLDHKFWKMDSAGITIDIPRKAKEFDRSFIRVYAFNKAGISNQILVPVEDGKVLTDAKNLTRNDREARSQPLARSRHGPPNVAENLLKLVVIHTATKLRLRLPGGDLLRTHQRSTHDLLGVWEKSNSSNFPGTVVRTEINRVKNLPLQIQILSAPNLRHRPHLNCRRRVQRQHPAREPQKTS
jgi:hypothetical protein